MVVFTCNNCGESLQKPKVEKHYLFACRSAKNVTCVDCFKDFRNEEYQAHTKCVTEEERYAAKGAYPNSIQQKGVVKQDSWIDLVAAAIESAGIRRGPQSLVVETVLASSNVPRKKAKFINFIKSTCGRRSSDFDIETVWDVIEKYKIKEQENAALAESSKKTSNNKEVVDDPAPSTPKSNGAASMNGIEELETKSLTVESVKIALKAVGNFDGSQKKLAKKVLKLENIPLKKKKFIKFVQNEIENANLDDVQALWDVVEKECLKSEDKKPTDENEDEKMEVVTCSNGADDKSLCLGNSTNTKEMSIELIKTALKAAEISKAIQKKLIKKILKLDNIPLKKKKFIKFIQNEFEGTDLNDIEAIWNVVQQHHSGLEGEIKAKSETSIDEVEEMMEVVTISNGTIDGNTSSLLNESPIKKGDISIELIKSALRIAVITDSVQQKLVKKILKLDNIPTTKKKFIKFIQKEIENSNLENIQAMWEIIEKNVANSKSKESTNSKLDDSQVIWNIVEKYIGNSEVPKQNGVKSDDLNNTINENNDESVTFINLIKSPLKNKSFSTPGQNKIKDIILMQTNLSLKKRRFVNNIKTQIDDVEPEDINTVWNFIQECKDANSSKQAQKRKANGIECEENKTKKLKLETQFNEKKRKSSENQESIKRTKIEENNADVAPETKKVNSFSYQNTISEILNKHNPLSLATLKKKVSKKYRKEIGEPGADFIKKFNKQLKKISNVAIDGDVVTILNNLA